MSLRQKIALWTRLFLVPQLMVGYGFMGLTLVLIYSQGRHPSRAMLRLTQIFSQICMRLMRVKVVTAQFDKLIAAKRGSALIVANHLSYLDVLAMTSVHPTVFVTSVEIKETPILGHISRLAGCLFVERRFKWNLPQEIQDITKVLKSGFDVVIFPEATTSNGDSLLPFKSSLMESAVLAGVEVIPICVNYQDSHGQRPTPQNRDNFYWYGDMTFGPHLWRVMKSDGVILHLEVLQSIAADRFFNRKQITKLAFQSIQNRFIPVG